MTAPTSARWRPSRAGILNVYQYEDETLHFAGGRLLLRGVNGSGKSTAMNMLLPFLLEADTRRIDAAGEQTAGGGGAASLSRRLRCPRPDHGRARSHRWLRTVPDVGPALPRRPGCRRRGRGRPTTRPGTGPRYSVGPGSCQPLRGSTPCGSPGAGDGRGARRTRGLRVGSELMQHVVSEDRVCSTSQPAQGDGHIPRLCAARSTKEHAPLTPRPRYTSGTPDVAGT